MEKISYAEYVQESTKNKKNVGCNSLWFYKIILCFDFDGVGFIMLLQMLHSCMSFENLEYNIGKEREFCVDIDISILDRPQTEFSCH